MPFPESPRVIFQKNPLVEVICQLRFPPILEIGTRDPADFQNAIRSEYPLYAKEEDAPSFPKEIAALIAKLGSPNGVTHRFRTEDEKRTVSLTPNFVAVSETEYERWENFRETVKRAKAALEDTYHPAFYSRIGLRYRDVIDRSDLGLRDQPWHELVNKQLLGALGAPEVQNQVQQIRTHAVLKIDEVTEGFVRLQHGLGPTDEERHGDVYTIDADFYSAGKIGGGDILGILDRFRKVGGDLFRWAITPRLKAALEPRELEEGAG